MVTLLVVLAYIMFLRTLVGFLLRTLLSGGSKSAELSEEQEQSIKTLQEHIAEQRANAENYNTTETFAQHSKAKRKLQNLERQMTQLKGSFAEQLQKDAQVETSTMKRLRTNAEQYKNYFLVTMIVLPVLIGRYMFSEARVVIKAPSQAFNPFEDLLGEWKGNEFEVSFITMFVITYAFCDRITTSFSVLKTLGLKDEKVKQE
mmetsp:Transcript_11503/g.12637  ORF Transcript_11503/g.12637 Transcript_11503/m.12637 type:complete len:203 (+) Transcript_11503:131-739(+)